MLGIAVYHINEVMMCRRNLSSKKVHYCRYSVPPLTFGCTFLGYRTPTITGSFLWTLITNEIISLFLFPYFAQLP